MDLKYEANEYLKELIAFVKEEFKGTIKDEMDLASTVSAFYRPELMNIKTKEEK